QEIIGVLHSRYAGNCMCESDSAKMLTESKHLRGISQGLQRRAQFGRRRHYEGAPAVRPGKPQW
ncbi:hypothetical protein ACQWKR_23695, partial [Salmonella enterica subsp. enterica serovar Infantis]